MFTRTFRLLLDPTAETSGGTAAATAETAAVAERPVTLPVAEYQRLTAAERDLAVVRADQARKEQDAENARLAVLAAKDGAEKALGEQRTTYESRLADANTKYATLEGQYLAEKKATAIADGLAGFKFVSADAALQARTLLEAKFSASRDAAGAIVVRDASGRPATEAVKEEMASTAMAHFLEPTTRGGNGGGSTHHREATTAATAAESALFDRMRQLAPGRSGVLGMN